MKASEELPTAPSAGRDAPHTGGISAGLGGEGMAGRQGLTEEGVVIGWGWMDWSGRVCIGGQGLIDKGGVSVTVCAYRACETRGGG